MVADLAVFAVIGKWRGLRHRLAETFRRQVRHPGVVAHAGHAAACVAGQADALAAFAAAVRRLELLAAVQRNGDGPPQLLRGDGGGDALVADPQLAAEAAAHIGRQDPHVPGADPQRIRQFRLVRPEHLVAAAQGHVAAVPPRHGGVGFHRRMAHRRGVVFHVHGERRVLHRLVQIALGRLLRTRRLVLRLGRDEHALGAAVVIVGPRAQRGVARLLERLGHDQRDRLALVEYLGRALIGRLRRLALGRVPQHPLVADHRQHARHGPQVAGVEPRDPPFRDRGPDQPAIDRAGRVILVGISGGAADL